MVRRVDWQKCSHRNEHYCECGLIIGRISLVSLIGSDPSKSGCSSHSSNKPCIHTHLSCRRCRSVIGTKWNAFVSVNRTVNDALCLGRAHIAIIRSIEGGQTFRASLVSRNLAAVGDDVGADLRGMEGRYAKDEEDDSSWVHHNHNDVVVLLGVEIE